MNELLILGLMLVIIGCLLYISMLVYEILNQEEIKVVEWLDSKLESLSKSVF